MDISITRPVLSSSVCTDLGLLGQSAAFIAVMRTIERVACHDATVLIQGETGTGKENAARAIHYLSERRNYPFVPINCGAIPENLLESELFGYEKGAFTDAKTSKSGLIGYADGGTLFLDEVDSLSLKGQTVLLRFIQDQTYRPIGGAQKTANIRIIAATNRNLLKRVEAAEFREDLFYRLSLLSLNMPPLRERLGDPELLAQHFIELGSKRFRVTPKQLHSSTLAWFNQYRWPGNIRELENLIYREILLSDGDVLCIKSTVPVAENADLNALSELQLNGMFAVKYKIAKKHALDEFEKHYIKQLLEHARGNISEAARISGKERRNLGRLIKKHGIIITQ